MSCHARSIEAALSEETSRVENLDAIISGRSSVVPVAGLPAFRRLLCLHRHQFGFASIFVFVLIFNCS